MDPFDKAITQGDEEDVSRQLDGDPTLLEHLDSCRFTPLAKAATYGQLGVVMLLVRRGANIEARVVRGRTALHWAAAAGRAEIVVFLLSKGAQADIFSVDASTPLNDAFLYGRVGVMHVLFQHLGPEGGC
jgi:ankyrin repeat protein